MPGVNLFYCFVYVVDSTIYDCRFFMTQLGQILLSTVFGNMLLLSCYNFRTRAWLSESSQHSKPEVEEWVSHFPQHHTSGTVPGICHDQLCRLPRLTRLDPMLAKCDISKPVKDHALKVHPRLCKSF